MEKTGSSSCGSSFEKPTLVTSLTAISPQRDARKATEVDPRYAKGWYRLGCCLSLRKLKGREVAPFHKAMELEPKNKNYTEEFHKALAALPEGATYDRESRVVTRAGPKMRDGLEQDPGAS